MAVTRDDLYHKFGPLLLEAIVLIIKDEINALRVEVGLVQRTKQQITDTVETKLLTLKKYNWMDK